MEEEEEEDINKLVKSLALASEESKSERHAILDKFLSNCLPNDLMYLSKKLDELKKDFVCLLPIEIVQLIFSHLDIKSLLSCCKVNKAWNSRLTVSLNRLWFDWCVKVLPLNQNHLNEIYDENKNYKHALVKVLRQSNMLENGELFKASMLSPVELSALSSYKNIIATATYIVKFWRFETMSTTFENFKTLELQSRASNLKFNDNYLVATTYFLTVDLYCLNRNKFLCQYYGHTCSISSFDFNEYLMLIVSGSPDNTIKFWSMDTTSLESKNDNEKRVSNLLIKSDSNLVWPVKIQIVSYEKDNEYLVVAICANGFIYVSHVVKFDDFISENSNSDLETFNFPFSIKISDSFKCLLSLYRNLDDENDQENLIISNRSYVTFDDGCLLTAFIITDNNSMQSNKFFIKKWALRKNVEHEMFEVMRVDLNDAYLQFLNTRSFKNTALQLNQFEIISFGYSYCLLMDDENNFYLSNLKNSRLKCIQASLNIETKQLRMFRSAISNSLEQFVFNRDSNWLNGFELNSSTSDHHLFDNLNIHIAFAFYTQYRQQVFIIQWNDLINQ